MRVNTAPNVGIAARSVGRPQSSNSDIGPHLCELQQTLSGSLYFQPPIVSLTLWNKSCAMFWCFTVAEAFVPITIHDQVVRVAAMFTWIGDTLIITSCSLLPLTRDPGRPSQEHTAVVSAFLTASHLLLCNDVCFVCKGLGVSCKALIPKPPQAVCVKLSDCLLAGVQGRRWGCKHLLQHVFRYHKHEH